MKSDRATGILNPSANQQKTKKNKGFKKVATVEGKKKTKSSGAVRETQWIMDAFSLVKHANAIC